MTVDCQEAICQRVWNQVVNFRIWISSKERRNDKWYKCKILKRKHKARFRWSNRISSLYMKRCWSRRKRFRNILKSKLNWKLSRIEALNSNSIRLENIRKYWKRKRRICNDKNTPSEIWKIKLTTWKPNKVQIMTPASVNWIKSRRLSSLLTWNWEKFKLLIW